MANKPKSIRDLVLAPASGFRTTIVTVPEWENAAVKLREPGAAAWLEWREIIAKNDDEVLSVAQEAARNLAGDITLFTDVLLDDDGTQVFTAADHDLLAGIYGPVHARLLKVALDLSVSPQAAEKK